MLLKILFPCLMLTGLFLLIKSSLYLVKVYQGNRQEFPAGAAVLQLEIPQPGTYELAVKRPSITGIVASDYRFRIINAATVQEVPIARSMNVFNQRKDLSGNRIVPVVKFSVTASGAYTLYNEDAARFKPDDALQVMPEVGGRGLAAILSLIFSFLLFLGGLICSLLLYQGKIFQQFI